MYLINNKIKKLLIINYEGVEHTSSTPSHRIERIKKLN